MHIVSSCKSAPIATSGKNVWTTDKNMPNNNLEVFFRASADSSSIFGNKITLMIQIRLMQKLSH